MMHHCHVCGNEINEKVATCPYCDAPQQAPDPAPPKRPEVRTLLLKEGQPTVEEAMDTLQTAVSKSRKTSIKVLRVIHGYGSSGEGGAIKAALIRKVKTWKEQGIISNYMTGEQYFEYGAKHNPLLKKYPELQETWNQDRGNKGITLIIV